VSRLTAPSDRDWDDEVSGPHDERIARACSRCGDVVLEGCSDGESYIMHPLCPACWRDAQATQARTITTRQKDSAA